MNSYIVPIKCPLCGKTTFKETDHITKMISYNCSCGWVDKECPTCGETAIKILTDIETNYKYYLCSECSWDSRYD